MREVIAIDLIDLPQRVGIHDQDPAPVAVSDVEPILVKDHRVELAGLTQLAINDTAGPPREVVLDELEAPRS